MIFFALMLFLTAVAFEETDADAEWVEIPTFLSETFFCAFLPLLSSFRKTNVINCEPEIGRGWNMTNF